MKHTEALAFAKEMLSSKQTDLQEKMLCCQAGLTALGELDP